MSGTGPTPAEQHLGDRLAALVDGELGHDARERVLAHLATCARCKAEADAQRRLKTAFAQSAPPPLSEGFLARLQGLPGRPADQDDDETPGPFDGSAFGGGVFGTRGDAFGYRPAVPGHSPLPGAPVSGAGFRIHEVGRVEADRSPWRGRRFAFAAASAVSFAAMALGGALPVAGPADTTARGTGAGVTPLTRATTTAPGGATRGRQGGERAAILPQSVDSARELAPGTAREPFTPHPFRFAVLDHFSTPPLIRPAGSAFHLAANAGPGVPPATPDPGSLASPTQPGVPLSRRR
ncbi:zf-HC2 domain-containing protein [Streptomyces sp. NBC_01498]|uniref:anti-sigma factor family protein n=1 Tax=Streptomyces sp. NBC_01498 TaxID=2975870 RepID=UPI002E7C5383|nr:zf-HC2 domain-containing protein [Streptomyces sp. NBC_01498]WTL24785.1 zf-HC2 domain-containing protein [Streptomyces sp. NBC_01498]